MNFETYQNILDACKTAFADVDNSLADLDSELETVNKELVTAKASKFSRGRTANVARLTNERNEVAKEISNYEAKRDALLNGDANPAANIVQTSPHIVNEIQNNVEATTIVATVNEHLAAIQVAIDSLKAYEQKQRENWHDDLNELDPYLPDKQYSLVRDMPIGHKLTLPGVLYTIQQFRIANNA